MSVEWTEASWLIGLNRYEVDEDRPHIVLDKEACRRCEEKPCLYVCPAVLYRLDNNGGIAFDYAGCLECGTCRTVCRNKGIVSWIYPRGTFGVNFRYG